MSARYISPNSRFHIPLSVAQQPMEGLEMSGVENVETFSGPSIAIVADPENPERRRVLVCRAIRDDHLGHLYANGTIDDSQFRAGRKWQAAYEKVWFSAHYADGGRIPDAVVTRDLRRVGGVQLQAWDELRRAKSLVGLSGASLFGDVLGDGKSIKAAAAMRGEGRCGKGWQKVLCAFLTKLADAAPH